MDEINLKEVFALLFSPKTRKATEEELEGFEDCEGHPHHCEGDVYISEAPNKDLLVIDVREGDVTVFRYSFENEGELVFCVVLSI